MASSIAVLADLTATIQGIGTPVCREIGFLTNLPNNMNILEEEAELLRRKHQNLQADGEEASRKRRRLTDSIKEIESMKSEFQISEAMSNWNCAKYLSRYQFFNLGEIQKKIMRRLELNVDENDDEERRSAQVLATLKSKRFLLILDGLWEAIQLDQVGIPKPNRQNKSKIIIATRNVEVCNDMEVDVSTKVKPLKKVEAWNLFLEKVGWVALQPDIQHLANKVAMECNGLPLALVTVGGRSRIAEKEASEPSSRWVWVANGFIGDGVDLVAASDKGYHILDRIKDACLLEGGRKGDKQFVKMHSLVRDMLLWITSPSFHDGPRFLVRAGLELREPPQEEMWREKERISLMRNEITSLPFKPDCPNLVSFSVRENPYLTTIHSSFFESMSKLSHLDLSFTAIESLPMSIGSVQGLRYLSLRGCEKLSDITHLPSTQHLRFLDLSHSGIISLPQVVARLTNLMYLNLSFMKEFSTMPDNLISAAPNLEELNLYGTSINWAGVGEQDHNKDPRKCRCFPESAQASSQIQMMCLLGRWHKRFGMDYVLDIWRSEQQKAGGKSLEMWNVFGSSISVINDKATVLLLSDDYSLEVRATEGTWKVAGDVEPVGLKAIKTPKTPRAKRELEKRAPKLVENGKKTLILQGTKTSNVLNFVLTEIYHLKKGTARRYTKKKDNIRPFESGGETSLEFFFSKRTTVFLCLVLIQRNGPTILFLEGLMITTFMILLKLASKISIKTFGGSSARSLPGRGS
ncbi:hypothetical protein AAC387_Pa10g0901 [Persea americana]